MEQYDQPAHQQPQVEYSQQQPSVRYGGFWRRAVAYLIDGGVLAMMISPFMSQLTPQIMDGMRLGYSEYAIVSTIVRSVATGVVGIFYFALMESSLWQGSLGKLAMGLIVTDENGMRISGARAFGRYFAKFISMAIMGFGFLMAGWTAGKRALHDMIAGTYVIERPLRG